MSVILNAYQDKQNYVLNVLAECFIYNIYFYIQEERWKGEDPKYTYITSFSMITNKQPIV